VADQAAGPRTGRRPGQPDTRGAILAAARRLFAAHGFNGASVRQIAAEAGVDPALVHHYFGTKDGLFRAALEIPIEPAVLLDEVFAAGVEQAPERLVRMFLQVWDDPRTGAAMASFLRTAVATEESAAMARQFFGSVVLTAASARLVDLDPDEVETRVSLVLSQMLGLVLARRIIKAEPLAGLPLEQLVAFVTPTVTRYLLGDLTPGAGATRDADRPHPIERSAGDEH
jgi:AcrR family transcriptional regulator